MKEIIEQLQQKVGACGFGTREDRVRRGAYVDCIMMVKEFMEKTGDNPIIVEADALLRLSDEDKVRWFEHRNPGRKFVEVHKQTGTEFVELCIHCGKETVHPGPICRECRNKEAETR